jgi:hypothetical protein
LLSLNLFANQVRNTVGVTIYPLKRISSRDLGQESEKGETRFHFLAEITKGDYTASKTTTLGGLEVLRLRAN